MPQAGRSIYIRDYSERDYMPIILWLLGVPISIILLLMLFGVVSF